MCFGSIYTEGDETMVCRVVGKFTCPVGVEQNDYKVHGIKVNVSLTRYKAVYSAVMGIHTHDNFTANYNSTLQHALLCMACQSCQH